MPTHTAAAVIPASLPSSLLITPFSVQMALRRLGEEPGAKDFHHDLLLHSLWLL